MGQLRYFKLYFSKLEVRLLILESLEFYCINFYFAITEEKNIMKAPIQI